MHPAIAARDYHIIQGKPALKADAMLARFQAAGGMVKWKEMNDLRVCAEFSHPQGGTVEIDWDMERAKAAQLGGKDMWKKFPRQMLRARVISEGIRTVYPGATVGVYTPEEVQDFEDKPIKHVKAEHIDEPKKAAPRQDDAALKVKDLAAQIRADLNAAQNLEHLNEIWTAYQDGLSEVKEFSATAYDFLETFFRNKVSFFANAPIDAEMVGE
jgi:hypothetical protein